MKIQSVDQMIEDIESPDEGLRTIFIDFEGGRTLSKTIKIEDKDDESKKDTIDEFLYSIQDNDRMPDGSYIDFSKVESIRCAEGRSDGKRKNPVRVLSDIQDIVHDVRDDYNVTDPENEALDKVGKRMMDYMKEEL